MILVKESLDLDGFNVGKEDMKPVVPIGGIAPAPAPKPSPTPPGITQLPVLNVPSEKLMADDADLQDFLAGSGTVSIQVGEEEPEAQEFDFVLPLVPGGEDQSPLSVEPEIKVEEPEEDQVEMPRGPWEWTVSSFMNWLHDRMTGIPRHSGKDTSGIERAISYLKRLDGEISRAVRGDLDDELDISKIEKIRDEILKGIERLEERLDTLRSSKYSKKKTKKSEEERSAIIKEASKSARFLVIVPLFMSGLGRLCINSMVSGGKDIEDTFDYVSKKFKLSRREEFELMQLLSDMGYAMRRDRGLFRDEPFDATSEDNPELAANYPG